MSELKTNLEQILQEKETKIIPENIKKDIQIFDVIGTYEGSGGGIDTSSDNPITAEDVAEGKEGFVNGEKVIGNAVTINSGDRALAINSPYTYQTGPVGQLQIYGQAPTWSDGQTSTLFKQGSQTSISILKEEQPDLANAIGLTSDKLVSGNTILGIEGTATQGIDTSDATATADDIVRSKTAYVNGEKITGMIYDHRGSEPPASFATRSTSVEVITYPGSDRPILQINFDVVSSVPGVIDNTTKCNTTAPGSTVAAAIGLTPDKIKAGETILGITGTYTGETTE